MIRASWLLCWRGWGREVVGRMSVFETLASNDTLFVLV